MCLPSNLLRTIELTLHKYQYNAYASLQQAAFHSYYFIRFKNIYFTIFFDFV